MNISAEQKNAFNENKEPLKQFLTQQGLPTNLLNAEERVNDFVKQMLAGEKNKSSLAMLSSHLYVPDSIIENQKVIAIDAGGTNLRCAHLSFERKFGELQCQIDKLHKFPMPGSRALISKSDFFEQLFQYIEPLLEEANTIGFCFSYACEISNSGDGKLLNWTKEINAPEVPGTWIGEELNQCLARHGYSKKRIILLNDTVATLLASKLDKTTVNGLPGNDSSNNIDQAYIGFILGTGTNCAYAQYQNGHVINIESGAYDGIQHQKIDHKLDEQSANPGAYSFEKKIAGRYLGELGLHLLLEASLENLVSEKCSQSITQYAQQNNYRFETEHLNNLMNTKIENYFFDAALSDKILIKYLIEALINRAAMLSAIQLFAIAKKIDLEANDKKKTKALNLVVNIEGSTYYQLNGYQENIRTHFDALILRSDLDISYQFLKTENASLVGAAIAALS